ncbi:hypothetical protein PR002_g9997 [Phytophthora rubi]|uniref:Retrovirus-related Pol polyprotein from transposon TNT 1-94-like beta-barrel domain-containing protein n=1 Tax=Phytophthora rubi TaxID=129364 RepID=A0A6A3MKD9_9STRA|nr:hypothetical protein PR002_g9997 [Phytophthora rubi]
MTLEYAIQALSGVDASDESSSAQQKAFVAKNSYDKRTEFRKKKADEERGQVARETSDYAFTATSAMGKTEWLVDSGARSHMTSVRDKFVSMKEQKTPVRITIADGRKIDAVAMGTVGLKLMDGTSTTLSGVLYISEVEGSLISVAKLAEKDDRRAVQQGQVCLSLWRCYRHGGQALWERLQVGDSGGTRCVMRRRHLVRSHGQLCTPVSAAFHSSAMNSY